MGHDRACNSSDLDPDTCPECALITRIRTDQIATMNETWQPILQAHWERGYRQGLLDALDGVEGHP